MKLNINGQVIEVEDENLFKALEEKKESFEIKSEDLVLRTKDEDTTFSDNLRKEGIATGAEIGRKEVIKGIGIEGEGLHKSDESAIEAINTFMTTRVTTALADAGKEPDKKIVELEGDILKLRETISTKDGELEKVNGDFTSFKKTETIKSKLSSLIPDNTVIPKDKMLTLMSLDIKADIDDNGNVFGVGANGEPIKDANRSLLPIKEVVSNFFSNNPDYLTGSTGGANGGDSTGSGGGKQTALEFHEEMMKAGNTPGSTVYQTEMTERVKAGTLETV